MTRAMLRRNQGWGLVVLLATALPISGCQGEPSTTRSAIPSTPPRSAADYPVIWLPTPALDLNSPDGTFARAYGESIYRSQWLGWDGVAPGFQEAYDPMLPLTDFDGQPLGYQRDARRRVAPHISYMWAAPFPEPDPAEKDDTGGNWRSLSPDVGGLALCVHAAIRLPKGVAAPALEIFTYRRDGTAPPADQQGPRAMPSLNVFGGWHGLDWILPTDPLRKRCDRLPTGAPPLSNDMVRSQPGWPADGQ